MAADADPGKATSDVAMTTLIPKTANDCRAVRISMYSIMPTRFRKLNDLYYLISTHTVTVTSQAGWSVVSDMLSFVPLTKVRLFDANTCCTSPSPLR